MTEFLTLGNVRIFVGVMAVGLGKEDLQVGVSGAEAFSREGGRRGLEETAGGSPGSQWKGWAEAVRAGPISMSD